MDNFQNIKKSLLINVEREINKIKEKIETDLSKAAMKRR